MFVTGEICWSDRPFSSDTPAANSGGEGREGPSQLSPLLPFDKERHFSPAEIGQKEEEEEDQKVAASGGCGRGKGSRQTNGAQAFRPTY